jgi:hypothetical protein
MHTTNNGFIRTWISGSKYSTVLGESKLVDY